MDTQGTEDYIKSAVECEISRMLAKNAMGGFGLLKSDDKPLDNGVKIKQEPVEEMEQDTSLQDSDHMEDESGKTKDGSLTVGSNKYSVKVVTKYMCRYCARQFDSPEEMQDHIASHTKGKASIHSCYVCGKTYSTPSKLQRHVRVHSGERPYACNICGRRFTRSDHVKQHLKVHMPQKQRNTCRLCGQKFLRRQTLHSHLQQSHGVSTVYTCHRCGEAFDEITKLHSHKNSHVSIYGKNEGPAVDGGMVIKQEPGANGDSDTPMIGLAKFSLGPQPAPDDLLKLVNSAQLAQMEGDSDGFSYKSDGFIGTTHRLAVAVHKQPQYQKTRVAYNYQPRPLSVSMQQNEEYAETENNTVSDGMNMFILPSDIKKEPESPGDSNDEGQTSYVDDIAGEDQDGHDDDDDGDSREVPNGVDAQNIKMEDGDVQNLLTGPPGDNKGIKMKLFGPASYKAAMRNKIAMKIPTPRLRQLQNPQVRNSMTTSTGATMTSSGEKMPSLNAKKTFSPYVVGGGQSKSKSSEEEPLSSEKEKKLNKCEHCCIWFEDYTMLLLHNSLHSADENDPFTCRKCLKKLGNRLEFTAHLVWHLEPDME